MKQFYVTLLGMRAVVTMENGDALTVIVFRQGGEVVNMPRGCEAWNNIVHCLHMPERTIELKPGMVIPALTGDTQLMEVEILGR